jgi:hypothetical protein
VTRRPRDYLGSARARIEAETKGLITSRPIFS